MKSFRVFIVSLLLISFICFIPISNTFAETGTGLDQNAVPTESGVPTPPPAPTTPETGQVSFRVPHDNGGLNDYSISVYYKRYYEHIDYYYYNQAENVTKSISYSEDGWDVNISGLDWSVDKYYIGINTSNTLYINEVDATDDNTTISLTKDETYVPVNINLDVQDDIYDKEILFHYQIEDGKTLRYGELNDGAYVPSGIYNIDIIAKSFNNEYVIFKRDVAISYTDNKVQVNNTELVNVDLNLENTNAIENSFDYIDVGVMGEFTEFHTSSIYDYVKQDFKNLYVMKDNYKEIEVNMRFDTHHISLAKEDLKLTDIDSYSINMSIDLSTHIDLDKNQFIVGEEIDADNFYVTDSYYNICEFYGTIDWDHIIGNVTFKKNGEVVKSVVYEKYEKIKLPDTPGIYEITYSIDDFPINIESETVTITVSEGSSFVNGTINIEGYTNEDVENMGYAVRYELYSGSDLNQILESGFDDLNGLPYEFSWEFEKEGNVYALIYLDKNNNLGHDEDETYSVKRLKLDYYNPINDINITLKNYGMETPILNVKPEGNILKGIVKYDLPVEITVKNLITGEEIIPEKIFNPNNLVTRAEICQMLVGALNLPVEYPVNTGFSDISDDYWASGYIKAAHDNGLMFGFMDNTFRPEKEVNRAEIAYIIYRAFDIPKYLAEEPIFTDAGERAWFREAVESLYNAGIINGYVDGTFRPLNTVHKSESAILFLRGMGIKDNYTENQYFDDLDGHWVSRYANTAYEEGLINLYDKDTFIVNVEGINELNIVVEGQNGKKTEVYLERSNLEDLNWDKVIDIIDLSILSQNYGKRSGIDTDFDSAKDLNNDGIIDLYDLVILAKKL